MAATPDKITYEREFQDHPNREDIHVIIAAMREGNRITREWFHKAFRSGAVDSDAVLGTQQKNDNWKHWDFTDVFTHADNESEQAIIAILKQHKNIPVVAEESGHEVDDKTLPNGSQRWLIDPLDGTYCFKHGNPDFSVTIALQKKVGGKWVTEVGAVGIPMHDEIYLAHDQASYLIHNDRAKKLRVRDKDAPTAFGGKLEDALRGKKIESVIFSQKEELFNDMSRSVMQRLKAVDAGQHSFSSAIMIAKLADGWVDGVILAADSLHNKGQPWDTDAAIHIAEKAGAKIIRKEIGGEPCVILANSQATLTALNQLVNQEYSKVLTACRQTG